jgi:hypothetical protein
MKYVYIDIHLYIRVHVTYDMGGDEGDLVVRDGEVLDVGQHGGDDGREDTDLVVGHVERDEGGDGHHNGAYLTPHKKHDQTKNK